MNLSPIGLTSASVPCNVPARRASATGAQLLAAARAFATQGGELVALWIADERDRDAGFCLRVAFRDDEGLTVIEHTMPDGGQYPDLSAMFPAASRTRAPRSTSPASRPTATMLVPGCATRAGPPTAFRFAATSSTMAAAPKPATRTTPS